MNPNIHDFDINAGFVHQGDLVEFWTTYGDCYRIISTRDWVFPVPSSTYLCYVNGQLRIDLRQKQSLLG